jgi:hypothetical protein
MEEGFWQLSGVFSNISGVAVPVEGRSIVTHTPEQWSNHAFMRILTAQPQDIENLYTFQPLPPKATYAQWRSTSPSLGDVSGCFAFAGDTIISSSIIAETRQHATEHLRLISSEAYENRGALFQNDTLVATWSVLMQRIRQPERLQ